MLRKNIHKNIKKIEKHFSLGYFQESFYVNI